jgi:hypothetical protein
LEYFSLLKEVVASEKAKMEVRRKYANVMEILLDSQQAAVNELDAQAQQKLSDAKSLYANAGARATTTIKQEEDLNARLLTISEQWWRKSGTSRSTVRWSIPGLNAS